MFLFMFCQLHKRILLLFGDQLKHIFDELVCSKIHFLHTCPFEKLFIEFEDFGLKMPHVMFSDATSKTLCSTFHLGNTFFGCKMTSDVQEN